MQGVVRQNSPQRKHIISTILQSLVYETQKTGVGSLVVLDSK